MNDDLEKELRADLENNLIGKKLFDEIDRLRNQNEVFMAGLSSAIKVLRQASDYFKDYNLSKFADQLEEIKNETTNVYRKSSK